MSEKVDNVVFKVGIPLTERFKGKSRYELVSEAVHEFNERKQDIDNRDARDFNKDTRVMRLSNGVIVSYWIEADDFADDFDLKKEYTELKEMYSNLISVLKNESENHQKLLEEFG